MDSITTNNTSAPHLTGPCDNEPGEAGGQNRVGESGSSTATNNGDNMGDQADAADPSKSSTAFSTASTVGKNARMIRQGPRLAFDSYKEIKKGIWVILLASREETGMSGLYVTEELQKDLSPAILNYYTRIGDGSNGSRSLKGYVDDVLSKMRTAGYLTSRGQLTDIGIEEGCLVLGLEDAQLEGL